MTQPDLKHNAPAHERRPGHQLGFSLLEVLIALLVLSIGLLGIAGLQSVSLRFNHQSYERSQATVLISEMFEKIIANPQAARNGTFDNVPAGTLSSGYTAFGSCPTACNVTELAIYDINQWKLSLEDPKKLAQGTGTIAVVVDPLDPASKVFDITVGWTENDVSMTQTMRARTLHR